MGSCFLCSLLLFNRFDWTLSFWNTAMFSFVCDTNTRHCEIFPYNMDQSVHTFVMKKNRLFIQKYYVHVKFVIHTYSYTCIREYIHTHIYTHYDFISISVNLLTPPEIFMTLCFTPLFIYHLSLCHALPVIKSNCKDVPVQLLF